MGTFRKSGVADFTRGGQIILHYFRMLGEVIRNFFAGALIVFSISSAIAFVSLSQEYSRYLTAQWCMSYVATQVFKHSAKIPFRYPDGTEYRVDQRNIVANDDILWHVQTTLTDAINSLFIGAACVVIAFVLMVRFVYRRGQDEGKDEHLRGATLVDDKTIMKEIKGRYGNSSLTLAGIPYPANAELAHSLVVGGPGSGKSTIFREQLASVRRLKQRAIVYDVSGDFLKNFYDPTRDIVLNPLDERCPYWDIWQDCHDSFEYEQMAESLISDAFSGDPFWTKAARAILIALAQREGKQNKPSMEPVLNAVFRAPLSEFIGLLEGSDAASILSKEADRMSLSIRSVLATYMRPFRHLRRDGKPFSIKEWVNNETGSGWIFITSNANQRALLRPLITLWMDIAIASILSLPPKHERRIYAFIDELPSLNRLSSLQMLLAESRKYGGCCTIGLQSYPQLQDIYGNNGAAAITGICTTWAVLRCADNVSADWASKGLGQSEHIETSEGISYGVSDIRDGVNLSKNRYVRNVVLATELTGLPDLNGYVRFGKNLPIASFTARHLSLKEVTKPFIRRAGIDTDSLNEPAVDAQPADIDAEVIEHQHQKKSELDDIFPA